MTTAFNTEYTLQAYQAQAARTSMVQKDQTTRLYTSSMGWVSEVGEAVGIIKHAIEQDCEIDWEHLREELGDALWYLSDLCTILGWSLPEIAHENILKLQRRHPNGFSAQTSIARMDKEAE